VGRSLIAPEQWQQVKDAFDQALDVTPTRRAAVLAAVADDVVRREVEDLLAAHDRTDGFLEPPAPPPVVAGMRFGRYQVVDQVGGGGMGEVYRAHDAELARDVAIKVVRAASDPAAHVRFEREARAIGALSHPHVLAVFDVGHAHGRPYLVTELLAGESLRARLQRGRPTVAQALAWAAQIAAGLAAAHAAGIVHRDLKPDNVFVVAGDAVKLLDFGLARFAPDAEVELPDGDISIAGVVVGTAGYLAPEQARGEPVTGAADLFALGAILFELMTGARAFPGVTVGERTRAALEHEPPPPSSLRPEVPAWIDRLVARCLCKDVAGRFASAADLAFVLGNPPTAPAVVPAPRPRVGRRIAIAVVAAAAGVAVGAALVAHRSAPRSAAAVEPPRPHPLTYGGVDREPAVSPDGRFLAFTSERDGTPRIWVKQLDTGSETALTAGPDSAPRFSPDGNQVLFTRRDGHAVSLHRVDLLGGEPRRVADDAQGGDWSPDGREVVFVRHDVAAGRPQARLMIARLGGGLRELHAFDDRPQRGRSIGQYARWSPDGATIVVSGLVAQPGAPQFLLLVPVDGGAPRRLPAADAVGLVSAVVWDGPGALIYAQARSASGNASAGSPGRLVRQPLDGRPARTLMWTTESSLVIDRWPGRGLVYDVRAGRQNLRTIDRASGAGSRLSSGTAIDRQPVLTPDGLGVLFSSNRDSLALDLWRLERGTGAARRLTEHPADDWDPALSPDGATLLWSSNRGGSFEIWTAGADGSGPRQVTHDGDAENPTIGADGAWIVYASGAAGRAGVWRVRPDGRDARRLVPDAVVPAISPDGRHVLFLQNREPTRATIGVATVADGAILPFTIDVEVVRPTTVLLGRARWTPDGAAIAFVGQDPRGATGVYLQAFAPAGDTRATRVALAGFDLDRPIESFDLDRATLVLAEPDPRSDIVVAEGLAP